MLTIEKPYLIFLGDTDSQFAKTASGVAHWCPEDCVGQQRLPGCAVDLGLPDLGPEAAYGAGARTLLIGIAPRGGRLPRHWLPSLVQALEAGLDIASGLHDRLTGFPELAEAAARLGRRLHDVRHPSSDLPVATGAPRSGHRALMIGTDCAVGKKFSALAIWREMKDRGMDADFVATGQTGILISGQGVALDAVPGDFIAGCAEAMTPDADPDHWFIVEGQATVLHPTFAAVTLGLLHGSQPQQLILCHEAGRREVKGLPGRRLPSLTDSLSAHLAAGRVTSPNIRGAGVSVNTAFLSEQEALDALKAAEDETGLPAADPIRFGAGPLVDALLAPN
ncbi:MAG: DUF1611 domain-containing protein [Parvularcula sp.]|jgi:uncharacterized NAD-dependent epimerase/dehydratase family protein|nr:DUF1611 domain-containing protein [Parvularcula sp.]